MGGDIDRMKDLIEQAARLLAGSAESGGVGELVARLEALPPRELVRFDWLSRSWYSGLSTKAIKRQRRSRRPLWEVLALVSGDGRERERGIRETTLSPLTARLPAIRATDWVAPVRAVALERLEECPPRLLIEALPLADQLAVERLRGVELHRVIDRLSDDSLRDAARAADPRIRRAAWRRLVERECRHRRGRRRGGPRRGRGRADAPCLGPRPARAR